MKRSLVLSSLASAALASSLLAAMIAASGCDVTQELQGAGADGGPDGSGPGLTASDASAPPADGSSSSRDGAVDSGFAKGPVSICVPQVTSGTAKILVNGTESPYLHDVNDISFTATQAFLLSTPFTFVAAPYGGGMPVSYDDTAFLPSYAAFAMAAPNASASGSRTSQNLGGLELPPGAGHVFALKGSTSSASDRAGEVIVDGTDLVFWTRSPAQLVQASLAGGAERVIADYPDADGRKVTAAALDATDLWFATAIPSGLSGGSGVLHRVPRAGGAVVDVANLPVNMVAGDLMFDGNYIHMGSGFDGSGELMMVYDRTAGTVGLESLMSKSVGSSRVVFDGTFFYWAESNGSDTCNGTFKRRNKDNSPEETLLTNLDRVVQLRTHGGAFYLGSASAPFRKPMTNGQLIEWKP